MGVCLLGQARGTSLAWLGAPTCRLAVGCACGTQPSVTLALTPGTLAFAFSAVQAMPRRALSRLQLTIPRPALSQRQLMTAPVAMPAALMLAVATLAAASLASVSPYSQVTRPGNAGWVLLGCCSAAAVPILQQRVPSST